MKQIDLRSDTVTQPCKNMRNYMLSALIGDDAYGEDPSVNKLQDYCKELFQVEDALFVTSGMMANRLAFLAQTSPGDEVVTETSYHVNVFDSAPMAAFSGAVINARATVDGILRINDIEEAYASKQRYYYFSQLSLISIENTINGWAGKIFPFNDLINLYNFADSKKILLHLDGARLFNAHKVTEIPLYTYAQYAHSLSVCFSKGLGAPYGSMLMGKKEIIDRARKFRLWLGGGVHQIGMNAAAAYYALRHNLSRLKDDHVLAQYFAQKLIEILEISIHTHLVETNIVQFEFNDRTINVDQFLDACLRNGLKLFKWSPKIIRAVTHLGVNQEDIDQAVIIIKKILSLQKK